MNWVYITLNSPIDCGWNFLPTISHVVQKCDSNEYCKTGKKVLEDFHDALNNFCASLNHLRHEAHIIALPGISDSIYLVAYLWKLDDNGTTVIAVEDKYHGWFLEWLHSRNIEIDELGCSSVRPDRNLDRVSDL